VGQFEELLSRGPLTLVLIYADWCGACHRFRDEVWNPLTQLQNATINRAAVRDDMVAKTSLANVEKKFYPTLLLVGNDKKPATFPSEEGGTTNAMPRQPTLEEDRETLTSLVNSPSVDVIAQNLGIEAPASSPSLPTMSIRAAPEVERSVSRGKSPFENQAKTAIATMKSLTPELPGVATNFLNGMPTPSVAAAEPVKMPTAAGLPPDVGADLVASQSKARTGTQAALVEEESIPAQRGGRMLRAIRRVTASLRAMVNLRQNHMSTRRNRRRGVSRKSRR
jgi:hypothetical protein